MSFLALCGLYFRFANQILYERKVAQEVIVHLSNHSIDVRYRRYHRIILSLFGFNIFKFLLLFYYPFTWRERILLVQGTLTSTPARVNYVGFVRRHLLGPKQKLIGISNTIGDTTVVLSGIYYYNCLSLVFVFLASGGVYYLLYFNHSPYIVHIVRTMLFPAERRTRDESQICETLTQLDLSCVQTLNRLLDWFAVGFLYFCFGFTWLVYFIFFLLQNDLHLFLCSFFPHLISAFTFYQTIVLMLSLVSVAFYYQYYLYCSFRNLSNIWLRNLIKINQKLALERGRVSEDKAHQNSCLCSRRDRVLWVILRHEREAIYAMLKKSLLVNQILLYTIITVLPISLLWLYQVMFENLALPARIFFSLGVACTYGIFGVTLHGFAQISSRLHRASGPLAVSMAIHFKARLPIRLRLLFKWSQCYERLHNKRKVAFTLGGVTQICAFTFFKLFMYYARFMIMTYKVATEIKR